MGQGDLLGERLRRLFSTPTKTRSWNVSVTCQHCGEPFHAGGRQGHRQKFCSVTCRHRAARSRWRSALASFVRTTISRIRSRTKKSGVRFDLDEQYILSMYGRQDARCAVTRLPFKLDASGRNSPYYPSVDRIDPRRGYERGNVQLVLFSVNIAKWRWDLETIRPILRAMLAPSAPSEMRTPRAWA